MKMPTKMLKNMTQSHLKFESSIRMFLMGFISWDYPLRGQKKLFKDTTPGAVFLLFINLIFYFVDDWAATKKNAVKSAFLNQWGSRCKCW
jgi:hypothetical protein